MQSLVQYILEKKSINFGSAKSNYGQCIILAGGPGSGKGYVKDHKILASFKSIDIDDLKKMYIKLQESGKIKDSKKYNLGNEKDVSELHKKVKEHGWKNKQREHFWSAHKSGDMHLPNILWDMVCGEIEDIDDIIKYAKPIGYNITLVWVCCNIDTAKEGNINRDRKVSKEVLEKGHKEAYKTLMDLFSNKYPETAKGIDNTWVAFSAGYKRELSPEYKDNSVIKIKKDENGNFDFKDKEYIQNFLKQQQPIDKNFDKKRYKEIERKYILKYSKSFYGKYNNQVTESNNGLDILLQEIKNEILT